MTLRHLLGAAAVIPVEIAGDAEIGSIQSDSRKCSEGSLFVCMPETTRPSESFIPSAAAHGAVGALVYTREGMSLAVKSGLAAALIPHRDQSFNAAVAKVCNNFFDYPTKNLKVVGITGTNGKTTTAWIVRHVLNELGHRTAYLGTLGFYVGDQEIGLENTTPFAVDLYNLLALARDEGADAVAMEVSSHALSQRRVDGIDFDVAVLTNLTQDHLDFHGTMEAYAAAKHRLFTSIGQKPLVAVFNVDDPHGLRWSLEQNGPTITYGLQSPEADLQAKAEEVGVDHSILHLSCRGEARVTVPLGGAYNVENALSAVAAVMGLGYPLEKIAPALSSVKPVPGRFEPVANSKGIFVLVDYAHTPDALEKLLDSVRGVSHGRLIAVIGCGGDRDRSKRPIMGRIASQKCDLVVVTSDNPRTEEPQLIIDEIISGVGLATEAVEILDRAEAIHYAINRAQPGDVVVIAGKGHENYQIIGREKFDFDDREVARTAMEAFK